MSHSSPLVLALGDSLIAGYGLSATASLPVMIEKALQSRDPGASVVNAGVSGDTTESALRRLPRVLTALSRRPDLALVQIGPNDVLRSIPPERTRAALDEILTELGRCGIPVLLATVEPPAFLRHRTGGYDGIHAALAARHGVATSPFFPPDVLGHPDMVLADRVHPNARAIALVAALLVPVIERALASAG